MKPYKSRNCYICVQEIDIANCKVEDNDLTVTVANEKSEL